MELYFVRHGRSVEHEQSKRQHPDSILGDLGRKQAKLLAKRFKNKEIDHILTSKWPRAFETAKFIGKKIKKDIEVIEGIHEKEQEASTYGLPVTGPQFEKYINEVKRKGSDLDWKYKNGGESIRDVIKRAAKFQEYLLTNHKNQRVITVSHGNFIRCFLAYCILGKDYDDKSFYKIFAAIHNENTGVTKLEYDEIEEKWDITYLNDHSHLGSLQTPKSSV